MKQFLLSLYFIFSFQAGWTNLYFDHYNTKIILSVQNTIADAGENESICTDEYALKGNVPAAEITGEWTLISGQGDIQDANSPTSLVTNLGLGENVFLWTFYENDVEISSDEVTITRNQNVTGTAIHEACESFTWIDGITYTESTNTPTFTLQSQAGCDSVVTLNLTINESLTGTAIHEACESFTWIDGITYTESTNTPTFTLQSQTGCDSVVTLNLTINESVTGTAIHEACESFTWIDNVTYTESTNTPTFTLQSQTGCDSVVTLNLTINESVTGTAIHEACESFTWIDDVTYTESTNTPTFTLQSQAGCDSVVTLNLTINESLTGTDIQEACESFTWIDDVTYTESTNTPTITLQSQAGCDSVVTLNLTINESVTGTAIHEACESYTWIDDVTYTESTNTPTFTLQSQAGCDSVVTLNLTINESITGTAIQEACESFTWIDGITYTESTNIPTFTLTSQAGCDSVVTLNLTINENITGIAIHEACESFTWIDDITYTESTNTPTFTLTSQAGCDSVVTLNLTINESVTGIAIHEACEFFTWIDGITYTESTNTPTFILTSQAGCDSVVTLNLTINESITGTAIHEACESFTWIDGITYTESTNTPTFTLTSQAGCDSVVTLNLTINENVTGIAIHEACESFTWIDDITYTESTNTPTFTLTSQAGCDSVVTLNLTINESVIGTAIHEACETFTWIDGITYTESTNTPTFTLTSQAGCDSVVTLNLTINESLTGTAIHEACESFTWIDGITYTESTNTPTFSLTSQAGCDSVVTLNLTINESVTGTAIHEACETFTWIDDITYTESTNTPTFTLTSQAGCDSVVTLNLTINESVIGTAIHEACETFTWIDGITYTESTNTPTFTLTSQAGCDSVVTLNLTINESLTGTAIHEACETFTWIDGITYTESTNTPTFTLTSQAGCDSVVTLNLTINESVSGTAIHEACESFTWIDGITYTESTNTPTFTLQSQAGCDSVVTLNLTINESVTGTAIHEACESFTWIDNVTYTESTNTPTFTLQSQTGCDSVVTLNLTINESVTGTAIHEACESFTWIDDVTYTESTNTPTFTLQSQTGCDSVVTLNLTIYNQEISNAGTNQNVCATSTNLAGNTPTVGTGLWTLQSGTGTITTPSSPTSQVTGLGVGANVFRWTISNGNCTPSFSEVTIIRSADPVDFTAGNNTTVCTTSFTLQGTLPDGASGLWSVISGTGTFVDNINPTSQVNGLSIGVNVFQWTVTSGACVANAQVTITREQNPSTANAGENQSICATTATLAGNTPTIGTGLWTLQSGTGTITTPSSPTSQVTGLGVGANVFRWTISNGNCTPSFSEVTITRSADPVDFTAGNNTTVCATSFTLQGTLPNEASGVWSVISGTGTFVDNINPTSQVNGLSIGVNVFQWTVTSGACIANAQVTITREQNPSTANAGENQSICATSTNLAGNTPSIGTGLWTLQNGTGTITTPSSPTSEVTGLGVGENVFRWTISGTTCPSNFDEVTITRSANPTTSNAGTNQNVCATSTNLSGNTPTVGTGLWTLQSGTGTITTPSSPTSQVTGLGVGTNVFRWTISNGNCTPSFSEVTITRSADPVDFTAGNNTTVCATSFTLQGTLPNEASGVWSVISGTGTFVDNINPTSQVNGLSIGVNVFQWTVTSGACVANAQVTITREQNPSTANAGENQSICATSTNLGGNTPSIGTGLWTLQSGTGTITNPSSPTSQVTGLGVGENVFRWTISGTTCPSNFDEVTITHFANPTTSNAGENQNVCATSTNLAGNTPTIGTGLWTLQSGTGTITTPSSPTSQVTGLGVGPNVFRWTISNGNCTPSFSEVTITRSADPVDFTAGNNTTICATSFTLQGTLPGGASGVWSVVSGTGTFTDNTSPTSQANGLSIGVNVFQWTVTSGACVANAQVTITREQNPSTANAGENQSICATSTNLSGNTPTVGTGLWTLQSGTGTITNPSSPTSEVTSLGVGANVFRWTISGTSCPSNFDEVTITRSANPTTSNAGTNQNVCATSTNLSGNTPTVGTGLWTLQSGTGTITTPSNPTSQVTGLGVGANVFRWTISNGNCTPSFSEVTITRSADPVDFTAGNNTTVCATSFTLQGTLPNGATGVWSVISGTGTFTNNTSPTSQVNGLSIGVNIFQWTVTSGACVANAQVTITREQNPSTANAGTNQNICSANATLAATIPSVGTGAWSLVSGAGTITEINNPNSTVSGLNIGANVFRWTVSGIVCPSNSAEVTITRFANPTTANAGQDQQICTNTTTLSANVPSIGTGQWTLVSGTGTILSPNVASTTVNGLSVGTNIFQWNISNGACPTSSDQVSIVVDNNPTAANAGADQNICEASTNLNGNNPGTGTGTWTLISGSGTIQNSNSPSSLVENIGIGTNVFRWTIVNGTCQSFDEVTIIRAQNPSPALAGNDQQICVTSTTMSATQPIVGNGTWTLVSGSGTISNANLANTQITNLGIGNNVFRWTVSNSFCTANADEVTIARFAQPTTSNAGTNQTVCSSMASLSSNNPSTGTGQWVLVSGTGNINNPNQSNSSVSGLSIGPNVFSWVITNGPCVSSSNVTITREANPSTANAGTNQTVCSESVNLNANVPTVGSGLWSLVSGNGVPQEPNNPATQVLGLGIGNNVFRWTVTNGTCPPSFSEVTINRLNSPQLTSAGNDQEVCTSTATMAAATPSVGTGTWTLISGQGTIAQVNNPNSAISNLGIGANVFRWTISNDPCPTAIDEVTITRINTPSVSAAGNNQLVCEPVATLNANTPTVGTGLWTVVSGLGTFTNPTSPTTQVSSLALGQNVFRWTISNGNCTPSSSDVTITRQLSPTVANAGQDQSTCLATTTLQGNTPVNETGLWTLISGQGTISNPTNPQSAVTNLGVGVNVFQWTITNGSCPPTSDQVNITRLPQPTQANAGADQFICSAQATLNANTPVNGEGFWSIVQGGGNFNNIEAPNALVSNLQLGLNVFRWNISLGVCDSQDEVSIFRETEPTLSNAGSNQQICGTTADLSANTPIVGTGQWSVISGTAFFENNTNPSTSVSNLSVGMNTLRWSISNGICPPSQSDVAIMVDTNPLIANAGPNQQVCSPNSTLSGNNPSSGTGVWTLVSGSGTITNPNVFNSTVTGLGLGINVFRWTITNGVCVTSDLVNIVRDQNPSTANAGEDQLICSGNATLPANTPSVGIGSWSLVSGSGNISNSFLPNSSVNGLGLGQNVFRWSISNGSCPVSSDDVIITRQTNPSVSVAGENQNVCSSQTILNANEPSIGLGSWTVTSGSGNFADANAAQTQVTGLSFGNNVFTWTVSNAPCPASSSQITVFRFQTPSVANAGPDQQICSGNTTLAAVNPSIGTGQWTLISGTGTIANPSAFNSTVSGLSAGQNVFRWTVTNGNCNPVFDEVIINRLSPPDGVDAGANQTICANNTQMDAVFNPGNGSGSWSVISGSGTFDDLSDPNTTVTGIGPGVNVFRWSVSNAACPAVSDDVTITRSVNPTPANAGNDQTICATSLNLSANNPVIGTGVWTLESGTGNFVNPNSPTTSVTGLSVGENIFRWTTSNGVCPNSSDVVIITRNAIPTTANAGSNQEICSSTTSISGNNPVVGSGLWSVMSGEAEIVNPESSNTEVINIGAGNVVLQWSISNGVCPVSSAQITISKTAPPSTAVAGNNQTICGNSLQLNATVPQIGTGSWSLISGTGTFTNPSLANSNIEGLQFGENVLRWTVSNGNCPPSISNITITAIQPANAANAGMDVEICGTSGELSAVSPTLGTGMWETLEGDIDLENIENANSSFTITQPASATLIWTVSNPGCPVLRDTVEVISYANPTIADAGEDAIDCANSYSLQGNSPLIGIGTWSVISGNGNFVNLNNPSTLVTNLASGDNVLQWSISNGVCLASNSQVTISVNTDPLIADAGANQSICDEIAQLNAESVELGEGIWSVISGTGIFSDVSDPNATVSGLSAGQNVFRWFITVGTCSANDDVVITRNLFPTVANAGNDQEICQTSTSLSANQAIVGTGTWSILSGSGNFVNANAANTTVNNLGVGVNELIWTIQSGVCPPSRDTVTILRIENPTIAAAGENQSICSDETILNANVPLVGTGVWSIVSGTGIISEIENPNTSITSIEGNGITLLWTISNGICPPSDDEVVIEIDAIPAIVNAGDDQQICSNSTLLQANTPSSGIGTWSVIQGSGEFSNINNPNTTVSGLSTGENIFEWTISNGTCIPISDQVTIIVDDDAAIADAGSDQEVCSNETTLNATFIDGSVGVWTVILGDAEITNPQSANTTVTGLSAGNNIFRWTVQSGSCDASFDEVSIIKSEVPSDAIAGDDQIICENTVQLSATNPAVGSGIWSIVSGDGELQNLNANNTLVNNLSVGTNIFRWTVSNGPCPVSFDDVSILVNENPSLAEANAPAQVCGDEVSLTATNPAVGSGVWTVISGDGIISNPNQAVTSTTLSIGTNVFRWTVSNGTCPENTANVNVISFEPPSTADAGEDQTICNNTSTLEAVSPDIGSGIWTAITSGINIADPTDNSSAVSNLTEGTNQLIWTVSNGICESSSDTLFIIVNEAGNAANAGEDQTICSPTTQTNANIPQGEGLWTLVSGAGTIVSPSNPQTQINNIGFGTNIFRWSVSGGICPSSTDQLVIIRFQNPSNANAGPDQQTCANSAQLQGNSPTIGTGQWQVISGNGTFSNINAPNSTVSNLAAGENVLRWTISNGNCNPSFDEVSIIVDDTPVEANTGPDQQVCAASTTLTANVPSAGTGTWTVVLGGAIVANINSPNTTVSNLQEGLNVLRWEVNNGECIAQDEISIVRSIPPDAAIVGPELNICGTSVNLQANTPQTGIGTWTLISGNGQIQNSNAPNTLVTNVGMGVNVFRWTISSGSCPSTSAELTVIRQPAPSPAIAGNDQTICEDTISLNGNIPTSGSGVWSLISGSGNIANALSPSTFVTNLGVGENVFQWTIISGNCPPSTSQVIIERLAPVTEINAGADMSICGNTVTLNATEPVVGSGNWSLISGSGQFFDATQANTFVSNLSIGINIFRWTVSNGNCTSLTDDVAVVAFEQPAVANAGIDQQICDTLTILQASIPDIGSGIWTLQSGIGNISNPDNNITQVDGLGAGTNVFRWTISNGICNTQDEVSIIVFEQPDTANAGFDIDVCAANVTLQGLAPSSGQVLWTSDNADITFVNPNIPNAQVNNLPEGLTNFFYTVSNGVCESSVDTMIVFRETEPSDALVMNDTTICENSLFISAIAPETGEGTWSVISGNATIQNANNFETNISDISTGLTVLRWTVTNGVCTPKTADVNITRFEFPTLADAGGDQIACFPLDTMSGNFPSIGSGIWSVVSGDVIILNPNLPFSTISFPNSGVSSIAWTISNGICFSSDTITVTNYPTPISDAGFDRTFCEGTTVVDLKANTPVNGEGLWFVWDGGGIFEDETNPQTLVSGMFMGNNIYEWVVTSGECVASTQVIITIASQFDELCQDLVPDVYIPEGFSPNNDDVNDLFVIQLKEDKKIDLKIYDRWGNKVYEAKDYQNDWDGKGNSPFIVFGDQLPEGTYYYLIDIEGEAETRKGFLTLWR